METLESLEKILKESPEDFILDNNVFDTRYRGLSLLEILFESDLIIEIEPIIFKTHLSQTTKLSDIIENSNTFFIKEITDEFRTFQEKLNEKHKWFKDKSFGGKKQLREENLDLFKKINTNMYNIFREIKRKELRTNSDLYKNILKCVKLISGEFYIDKEKHETVLHGLERKKEKVPRNLDTDEKIISFAFEKVLTENKDISIVSNDEYMRSIFNLSYDLLTCLELNHCLSDLRKNNISFYGIVPSSGPFYNLLVKTNDKKMQEKFLFPERDMGTNKYLREKIDSILSKSDR